jgi:hypothetical protein
MADLGKYGIWSQGRHRFSKNRSVYKNGCMHLTGLRIFHSLEVMVFNEHLRLCFQKAINFQLLI